MDVATVVFSHVQCVKTRVNLSLVSKLWRDASKTAAAYPLEFDFDAFSRIPSSRTDSCHFTISISMMDNDEALSLPYERVVGLLDGAVKNSAETELCNYAALQGSVRLLKWARVNNRTWGAMTCTGAAEKGHLPALKYLHENGCPWDRNTCDYAAMNGHLPTLKYLHENGCPWDRWTCHYAACYKHWDCLQYAVDNKCEGWEEYAEEYAEHLR